MNNYCMIQNSKTFAFSAENPTGVRAVSYTHLDVYKRQVSHSGGRISAQAT